MHRAMSWRCLVLQYVKKRYSLCRCVCICLFVSALFTGACLAHVPFYLSWISKSPMAVASSAKSTSASPSEVVVSTLCKNASLSAPPSRRAWLNMASSSPSGWICSDWINRSISTSLIRGCSSTSCGSNAASPDLLG
ncbi:hypothetical protein BCR43DRAFT_495889 [Syncephalastrum racemosum]|uniref:Uncharacterized protein n=1 Tax=Syncephalastrum racemosum TaxID=13706 RepID=A0A1X2H6K7_SYNRA|nr:hypothetical protein BCR43DRAFT_495889 [Syncephalastrum racemosum]